MKDSIRQFTLVIIAVLALSSLMGFARPAADEPKQYMIVSSFGVSTPGKQIEKLEANVKDKIAEGWRPQGGVGVTNGGLVQAMVK